MIAKIVSMGHFTAVGMRARIDDPHALIINTCSGNGTAEVGHSQSWIWSNPTNMAIKHHYAGVTAVSTECLWQGCKVFQLDAEPNESILNGSWKSGKGWKPVGSWSGTVGKPIQNVGQARRTIYIPSYRNLIEHWLQDGLVQTYVRVAREWNGPVYLRDHDTGRGVDRDGPISHAWLLAEYLNTGKFPD